MNITNTRYKVSVQDMVKAQGGGEEAIFGIKGYPTGKIPSFSAQ